MIILDSKALLAMAANDIFFLKKDFFMPMLQVSLLKWGKHDLKLQPEQ